MFRPRRCQLSGPRQAAIGSKRAGPGQEPSAGEREGVPLACKRRCRRRRLWGTSMEQTLPGAPATWSGCCMVDERGRATGGADRRRLWGTRMEQTPPGSASDPGRLLRGRRAGPGQEPSAGEREGVPLACKRRCRRRRLWGTSMEQTLPGAPATWSGCCMVDERGRATGGADRRRLWGTFKLPASRVAVE